MPLFPGKYHLWMDAVVFTQGHVLDPPVNTDLGQKEEKWEKNLDGKVQNKSRSFHKSNSVFGPNSKVDMSEPSRRIA